MMRGCLAGLVAVVLLVSGSANTLAQTPQEKALAKKRYKVGEQLYDISQYDKALVEFEEAYRLYPLPDMLYNIARCHEVLANLEKAIETYNLFLQKQPDSPHAPLIKTRIKSLEDRRGRKNKAAAATAKEEAEQEKAAAATAREMAVQKKAMETPEPPSLVKHGVKAETPVPLAAHVEEPAEADAARTWRWTAGWAGVGMGGASLVAGIAFGALASGKNSEYEEQRDTTGTFADLKELRDSGEQYQTVGIALMVAGGVIAAAGGGLLIWELMGGEEDIDSASAMFMPVVTQDSAGFAASLRF